MIEVSKVNFTIMGDVPVTSKTLVKDIQDHGNNKSIESILLTIEDIHVFITLDFVKQDIKAYLDDLVINHIEDIQFYRFCLNGSVELYSISPSNCYPDIFTPKYKSLGELLDDIAEQWDTMDNFLESCTCRRYMYHSSYNCKEIGEYHSSRKLKGYQVLIPGYFAIRDFIQSTTDHVIDLNVDKNTYEKYLTLSVSEDKGAKLFTLDIKSDSYSLTFCNSEVSGTWSVSFKDKKVDIKGKTKCKCITSLIDSLFSALNKYYDISTSAMFKLHTDAETFKYNREHLVAVHDNIHFTYTNVLPKNCLYVSGVVKSVATSTCGNLYNVKKYIRELKVQEEKEHKRQINSLKEVMASEEYAKVWVEADDITYKGDNPDILKVLTPGERYKFYTFYVTDGGIFYILENGGAVHLTVGSIQEMGTGACLSFSTYTANKNEGCSYGDFSLNTYNKGFKKGGITLISDSKEELKNQLLTLNGKSAKENEIGRLQKVSLVYRFCSLVSLKDTPFGLLLYFENSTVYISKVSLKVYVNSTKTTNKDAIESAKKAVKLPVVRQFVKKVNYTYSVYEVSQLGTKLSANSSYSRKFVKRYADILEVLNLSKKFKDLYLRVKVYSPDNKEFKNDCVVHDGSLEVV